MLNWLSALALGLGASAFAPQLPGRIACSGLVFVAVFITITLVICRGKSPCERRPIFVGFLRLGAAFLLGLGIGLLRAHLLMAQLLPGSLNGSQFCIVAEVVDLPAWQAPRWQFNVKPLPAVMCTSTDVVDEGGGIKLPSSLKKIRLSWQVDLDANGEPLEDLKAGSVYQFFVRLKRPRGFVNPEGFDYQAWLMMRSIGAVGQVKGELVEIGKSVFSLDRFRQKLGVQLDGHLRQTDQGENYSGLIHALLLGEKRGISPTQIERLKTTGTIHLIAISGLHIGIAAMIGRMVGGVCARLFSLCFVCVSSIALGRTMAFIFASAYSALAGFSLPTVRALLMLSVFLFTQAFIRPQSAYFSFLVALVLVLLLEPLAPFDAGFYLSFGAVFCLLFTFSGAYGLSGLKAFLQSQKVLFVVLLLPLCYFAEGASLLAPLANFVAIPLVSLLVVPSVFVLGLSVQLSWHSLVELSAPICVLLLAMLIQWLEFIGVNYSGDVYLSSKNLTAPIMMMTALASFICLLPSGFPGRLLGFMGFLPFYFGGVSLSSKIEPLLELRVLDVGQGLAVHINVQGAHVLYDTGAYFSARFDIGTHVLLPYLEAQNVKSLETLIISHEDNDHVGGMSALVKRLPVENIYRSYTSNEGDDESHMNCHQAKPWRLGEAVFQFLRVNHSERLEGNNLSCVLFIQVGPHSILLPGDLEREGEFALLAGQAALQSSVSLMLAPHHGSQTSSSYAWLYHWRPKRIALSAGFENAYGHPHVDVLKRYELLGAELLATGEEGALSYQFYPRSHPLHVTNQRQRALKSRYWYREYPALFSD